MECFKVKILIAIGAISPDYLSGPSFSISTGGRCGTFEEYTVILRDTVSTLGQPVRMGDTSYALRRKSVQPCLVTVTSTTRALQAV